MSDTGKKDSLISTEMMEVPCGIIVFTFDGSMFTLLDATERYYALLGYSKEDYVNAERNRFGLCFCSEEYADSLRLSFLGRLHTDKCFTIEFQARKRDGSSIWLQGEFQTIDSKDGLFTVRAAVFDITGVKKTTAMTDDERSRLLAVAELSADMLFEYDILNDTLTLSRSVRGEFKTFRVVKDFEQVFKAEKLVHEDDIDVFEKMCENMQLGKESIMAELRLYDKECEDFHWNKFHGKAIYDDDGTPLKIIGKIVNISEHKETERRLIDKAERDPLTKIYNKATTRSLVKDYLRTDSRETLDALMIIDVDNFKSVNDNLGHLFGDSILIDLSQEMQDLFRSSDVVGRIGGDEFLVFLRGIKQQKHIEDKANDICRIFELLYSGENGDKITGSIGISIFPKDGETYEELFKKADIALYTSKGQGKNCFNFYKETGKNPLNEDNQIHVNRYKKDIAIVTTSNVFDSEITDYAFDIMNKTKDVSSAINLLLSKVGKHFNLGRVSVLEAIDQPFCLKYTYQWCANGTASKIGAVITTTKEQWISLMQSYDENDICCYSDINALSCDLNDYALQVYREDKVMAILECAIFDSGEYKGCVSFNDCRRKRTWTLDEVKALKTISKIISSYLLKMRAFEKANNLVDRLTNYDKLTGLPRFNKFKEQVQSYIDDSESGEHFVLAYLDINNFKFINEKTGSENGDRILKGLAQALVNCPVVKYCCRVFSDKYMAFAKVDEELTLLDDLKGAIADYMLNERLSDPDCTIAIASGVYVVNDKRCFDFNTAMDNANIARKRSKEAVEAGFVVYKEEMKAELNAAIVIVNEAEHAILNHEFLVYYQPKISLKTNKVVGAEALVRWRKNDGQIIPPDKFIPYLEKSGFIVNVDFYVYEEVCRYVRRKLDAGEEIVPISLNVSRLHLKDSAFLKKVTALVSRYEIPPHLLEFELTESVFLENQDAAVNTMEAMKNQGFVVSIDDFGAGFSSLNLLKNLPVDILKIDKEFFGNYHFKTNDEIVISSIIGMANKMKIAVICEGVETEEQVDFLRETECDMVQGYYFAKPVPQEMFDNYSTPQATAEKIKQTK